MCRHDILFARIGSVAVSHTPRPHHQSITPDRQRTLHALDLLVACDRPGRTGSPSFLPFRGLARNLLGTYKKEEG